MIIDDVIGYFGNRMSLAFELEVSAPNVYIWCKNFSFPYRQMLNIEKLTKGKFKAIDIMDYQNSCKK